MLTNGLQKLKQIAFLNSRTFIEASQDFCCSAVEIDKKFGENN